MSTDEEAFAENVRRYQGMEKRRSTYPHGSIITLEFGDYEIDLIYFGYS